MALCDDLNMCRTLLSLKRDGNISWLIDLVKSCTLVLFVFQIFWVIIQTLYTEIHYFSFLMIINPLVHSVSQSLINSFTNSLIHSVILLNFIGNALQIHTNGCKRNTEVKKVAMPLRNRATQPQCPKTFLHCCSNEPVVGIFNRHHLMIYNSRVELQGS